MFSAFKQIYIFLNKNTEDAVQPKNLMWTVMVVETIKLLLSCVNGNFKDTDNACYILQGRGVYNGVRDYDKVICSFAGPTQYPAMFSYFSVLLYKYVSAEDTYYSLVHILGGLSYLVCVFFMVKIVQLAFKDTPEKANIMLIHCFTFTSLNIAAARAFNDVYCAMFCIMMIYMFQKERYFIGSICFSLGLGVKMSAMLYIPAFLLISSRAMGIFKTVLLSVALVGIQLLSAYQFLAAQQENYLTNAYNFGRSYGYGWSYNWRLFPSSFGHSNFIKHGLLILQVSLLLYFLFKRWIDFRTMFRDVGLWPFRCCTKNTPLSPYYVAEVFLLCNFTGIICSRAMHYQFFIWYSFSIPFLVAISHQIIGNKLRNYIAFAVLIDLMYTDLESYDKISPTVVQILSIFLFYKILRSKSDEEAYQSLTDTTSEIRDKSFRD